MTDKKCDYCTEDGTESCFRCRILLCEEHVWPYGTNGFCKGCYILVLHDNSWETLKELYESIEYYE